MAEATRRLDRRSSVLHERFASPGLVGFTVTLALVVQALVALHALLGVEADTLRQHARQLHLALGDDRRRLLKLRHRVRGRLEIHDADTGLRSDPNPRSAGERRSVRQDSARTRA